MRNILHIFLLLFLISACRAQSSAGENSPACDLLVSFSSKGSGINHTAGKALKKYLEDYSRDHKRPAIDTIRWGREGETDYCIQLTDTRKKDAFVSGIKELLKEEPQVSVEENKSSEHKR